MEIEQKGTLQKILQVANKEFLAKGFKDASLRAIVKEAGVTTGAFYGYFKSKEELFDALVKEHADYIMNIYDTILEDFQKLPVEEQSTFMDSHSHYGIEKMFDYVWNHKEPFLLISKFSAGTKYEKFIQQIAAKDIESTEVFLNTMESNGKKVERIEPIVEDLILNNTFNMFFSLILKDLPREKVEHCLEQLFTFHRGGWDSLFSIS
ncbi:MAG: TetR/AcrR family transcriptional regulator [Treponema sp.]|nr:TetR/AcrR family transcriptional regulator [Treponema sp.]